MSSEGGLSGDLLRLKAVDSEDLQVIAGMLQDAIVPVLDIAHDPAGQCFMFAANRYRWEKAARGGRQGSERIHCGVTFANVTGVRRRGIDRREPGKFLNLLTISLSEPPGGAGPAIELIFAGEAAIRLETTGLLCHLEDFGEPWPAQWQPRHAND